MGKLLSPSVHSYLQYSTMILIINPKHNKRIIAVDALRLNGVENNEQFAILIKYEKRNKSSNNLNMDIIS